MNSASQKRTFLEDKTFLAAGVDVTGLDELGSMVSFGDLVALPSSADDRGEVEVVSLSILVDTPSLGGGRQHWGRWAVRGWELLWDK